jgi:hypothetical protein
VDCDRDNVLLNTEMRLSQAHTYSPQVLACVMRTLRGRDDDSLATLAASNDVLEAAAAECGA